MSRVDLLSLGDDRIVELRFDGNEANILSAVAEQLRDLITDWPDDAAAQRLFPQGYQDAEAQAEFSRFTRAGLAERKVAAATAVISALGAKPAGAEDAAELEPTVAEHPADAEVTVRIPIAEVWPWLTFFTDVRLVLAERLEAEPDSEESPLQHGIYEWTSALQAAIVDLLSAQANPSE